MGNSGSYSKDSYFNEFILPITFYGFRHSQNLQMNDSEEYIQSIVPIMTHDAGYRLQKAWFSRDLTIAPNHESIFPTQIPYPEAHVIHQNLVNNRKNCTNLLEDNGQVDMTLPYFPHTTFHFVRSDDKCPHHFVKQVDNETVEDSYREMIKNCRYYGFEESDDQSSETSTSSIEENKSSPLHIEDLSLKVQQFHHRKITLNAFQTFLQTQFDPNFSVHPDLEGHPNYAISRGNGLFFEKPAKAFDSQPLPDKIMGYYAIDSTTLGEPDYQRFFVVLFHNLSQITQFTDDYQQKYNLIQSFDRNTWTCAQFSAIMPQSFHYPQAHLYLRKKWDHLSYYTAKILAFNPDSSRAFPYHAYAPPTSDSVCENNYHQQDHSTLINSLYPYLSDVECEPHNGLAAIRTLTSLPIPTPLVIILIDPLRPHTVSDFMLFIKHYHELRQSNGMNLVSPHYHPHIVILFRTRTTDFDGSEAILTTTQLSRNTGTDGAVMASYPFISLSDVQKCCDHVHIPLEELSIHEVAFETNQDYIQIVAGVLDPTLMQVWHSKILPFFQQIKSQAIITNTQRDIINPSNMIKQSQPLTVLENSPKPIFFPSTALTKYDPKTKEPICDDNILFHTKSEYYLRHWFKSNKFNINSPNFTKNPKFFRSAPYLYSTALKYFIYSHITDHHPMIMNYQYSMKRSHNTLNSVKFEHISKMFDQYHHEFVLQYEKNKLSSLSSRYFDLICLLKHNAQLSKIAQQLDLDDINDSPEDNEFKRKHALNHDEIAAKIITSIRPYDLNGVCFMNIVSAKNPHQSQGHSNNNTEQIVQATLADPLTVPLMKDVLCLIGPSNDHLYTSIIHFIASTAPLYFTSDTNVNNSAKNDTMYANYNVNYYATQYSEYQSLLEQHFSQQLTPGSSYLSDNPKIHGLHSSYTPKRLIDHQPHNQLYPQPFAHPPLFYNTPVPQTTTIFTSQTMTEESAEDPYSFQQFLDSSPIKSDTIRHINLLHSTASFNENHHTNELLIVIDNISSKPTYHPTPSQSDFFPHTDQHQQYHVSVQLIEHIPSSSEQILSFTRHDNELLSRLYLNPLGVFGFVTIFDINSSFIEMSLMEPLLPLKSTIPFCRTIPHIVVFIIDNVFSERCVNNVKHAIFEEVCDSQSVIFDQIQFVVLYEDSITDVKLQRIQHKIIQYCVAYKINLISQSMRLIAERE